MKIKPFLKNFIYSIFFLFQISLINSLYAEVDYIRMIFRNNACHSVSIIWNQKKGKNPILKLYSSNDEKVIAHSVNKKNHFYKFSTQIVRLNNLQAKTKYYFYIIDSEDTSKTFYFETVSKSENDTLSIIAGGDSRDNRVVRTKANKMLAKLKADVVLFNGDFIGLDVPKQWKDWFEDWEKSIADDGRITPLVITRGNHEKTNKVLVKLFDVPNRKVVFNTEFGDNLLNVISLNSEILKFLGQKRFLSKTLKDHKNFHWQIAQYHRPVRPHVAHKKEMENQYKHFVPLFEKYTNLKLCLENDSHTAKITYPIVSSKDTNADEGFVRDDKNGIVYAGEGCWGAPLRKADDKKSWTRDAEAVNQFNWIFVSKNKIEIRTILYENENQVNVNSSDSRFKIPENLVLWGENGKVVEILK
ncbi:MAG: metallophosphoesterase family protein [Flavobacteriia bacterium]|nr:metallophosphoesterase family protein [Flavobacteriia bacterium]